MCYCATSLQLAKFDTFTQMSLSSRVPMLLSYITWVICVGMAILSIFQNIVIILEFERSPVIVTAYDHLRLHLLFSASEPLHKVSLNSTLYRVEFLGLLCLILTGQEAKLSRSYSARIYSSWLVSCNHLQVIKPPSLIAYSFLETNFLFMCPCTIPPVTPPLCTVIPNFHSAFNIHITPQSSLSLEFLCSQIHHYTSKLPIWVLKTKDTRTSTPIVPVIS